MTAVVIQEGSTPRANTTQVQVQLAAPDAQNVLTVFVDGTIVDFSDPLSQSKEFYSKRDNLPLPKITYIVFNIS